MLISHLQYKDWHIILYIMLLAFHIISTDAADIGSPSPPFPSEHRLMG